MTSISGFGTLLQIGDGATPTENFTTIAQVTNIGGPGLAQDAIDATHHGSAGGWREFIGGLLDAGEVTFDINWDPAAATHDESTGLIADLINRTLRNFQLVWPDAGNKTAAFAALVTGFEPSAPIDDKLAASVALKLSGQITWP